jgi:AraC family transcriptional activator of pyochelin receptor
MAFTMQDISGEQLEYANKFFLYGFENTKLVERFLNINQPSVQGISHEWYFDGIRMAYFDVRYKKPTDLKWDYHINIDLVTFQVNLEGYVFMADGSGSNFQLMGNQQHNLFYSNANQTDGGFLKDGRLKSSMFFIQFTKSAFLRLTADANLALSRFNENVANGNQAMLSPNNLRVNAAMLDTIKSIVNCAFENDLKKMYLLSKSIEFLVLQAESCNKDASEPAKYIKTKYEQDCIIYARDHIMHNLESPPGLSALAKIVGINEYKLKRGFKETFGNTVFGYLSDARLEFAKHDLLEDRKTSAEIAFKLGYSSPQHFSNAFKKKFGVSPNKFKG